MAAFFHYLKLYKRILKLDLVVITPGQHGVVFCYNYHRGNRHLFNMVYAGTVMIIVGRSFETMNRRGAHIIKSKNGGGLFHFC